MFPVRGRVWIRLLCLSFEQLERNLHSVQGRFYFARAESLSRCSSVTSSLCAVPLGRNISQVCPALHCFLTLGIEGVGLLPGCSSVCTLSEILLSVHKRCESAQRGQTLLSFALMCGETQSVKVEHYILTFLTCYCLIVSFSKNFCLVSETTAGQGNLGTCT